MRNLSLVIIFSLLLPAPIAAKYVFHLKNPAITASSQFAFNSKPWRYPALNVFDGDAKTVWCEGAEDHNGTGEYIEIKTKSHIRVQALRIKNGFSRDAKVAAKNHQVKRLSILSLQRKTGTLRNRTAVDLKPVSFNSKNQAQFAEYKLPKSLTGRRFRFVIADVYINPKDKTRDVCMGEIQIGTKKSGKMKWLDIKQPIDIKQQRKRLRRLQEKAENTLPLSQNKKLPYGKSISGVVRSLPNGDWSTEPVSEMDADTFYLCADGSARRGQKSAMDGFNDSYGTWRFVGGRISIDWTESVQHVGVGDPTDSVRNLLFTNMRTSRRKINQHQELKWQPTWPHIAAYTGSCRYVPAKKLELNVIRGQKQNWKAVDKDGYTQLMWAVTEHNSEVVRFLAKRSPINHINKWSDSALSLAVDSGDHEIVHILLKAGADPKKYKTQTPVGPGERQYSTRRIPVLMAIRQLKPKILRALLKTGYPIGRKYKADYQAGQHFTLKSLAKSLKPEPGSKDRYKRTQAVLNSFAEK